MSNTGMQLLRVRTGSVGLGEAPRLTALLWGAALWLYAYHLFVVSARGFVRMFRGRNGWAKTRRNAEPVTDGPVARES
ncbi:hypothetical protein [Streptomyces noursei]|uniref:hypothetical protein n=1 Tax=Streptomyces noursei TaxID=1971 RepID=UPI003B8A6F0F